MRPYIVFAAILGTVVLVPDQQSALAQGINIDTAAIEQATGLKGQLNAEENVFKVTKPRTDVKIAVDQWTMPAFMGLGSWAAFTPAHDGAMLMGDTVVFEDEVNPAMSAAFDAGLEVTALHNHFFFDEPKVYFMHIGGTGDPGLTQLGHLRWSIWNWIPFPCAPISLRSGAPRLDEPVPR